MSDILTKCSSYHFVHRATCGFQPKSPAVTEGSKGLKGSDKPLHTLKPRDKTIALIFVEFCCDEQSALSQHNTAFAYIGVTAEGKKHRLCEACWNELNACVLMRRLLECVTRTFFMRAVRVRLDLQYGTCARMQGLRIFGSLNLNPFLKGCRRTARKLIHSAWNGQ